jgi:hypothetical protein
MVLIEWEIWFYLSDAWQAAVERQIREKCDKLRE